MTSYKPPLTARQQAILALLRERPGLTTRQVQDALGIPFARVRESLDGLYVRGLIGRQHALTDSSVTAMTWWPEAVEVAG